MRLVVARATSPDRLEILQNERAPVRLGHNAFTRRELSNETISEAVRAFRTFREIMDHYHTSVYRAVATSAAREARNRQTLIDRVRRKAGIALEVITGEEEARLVCKAVLAALQGLMVPRLIFDLGGGSLELNFYRGAALERRIPLPLGTVRLMETYGLEGPIGEDTVEKLRLHTLALLRSAMPVPPNLSGAVVVACGGNAESLASLAPGPRIKGVATINLRLMKERAWEILRLDVAARMKTFRLRRDRAEVVGIAAIVLDTLGSWLNLRSLAVPAVGVREGILLDLLAAQYVPAAAASDEQRERTESMLAAARWFGRRLDYDAKHAEQVKDLAVTLFDQLHPLHEMGPELRAVLEAGSLLHDVGHFISHKAHHRHGDYLVRNAQIPGLRGWRRNMVASLVRYHNAKSEPQLNHHAYASLGSARRRQLRQLTALLRIAEKLESEHRQGVSGVDVDVEGNVAFFRIHVRNGTRLNVESVARKARMFEREFHLEPVFKRAQSKIKVA